MEYEKFREFYFKYKKLKGDKKDSNQQKLDKCPRCQNKSLRTIIAQMRSLDEGQTTIRTCIYCGIISKENS